MTEKQTKSLSVFLSLAAQKIAQKTNLQQVAMDIKEMERGQEQKSLTSFFSLALQKITEKVQLEKVVEDMKGMQVEEDEYNETLQVNQDRKEQNKQQEVDKSGKSKPQSQQAEVNRQEPCDSVAQRKLERQQEESQNEEELEQVANRLKTATEQQYVVNHTEDPPNRQQLKSPELPIFPFQSDPIARQTSQPSFSPASQPQLQQNPSSPHLQQKQAEEKLFQQGVSPALNPIKKQHSYSQLNSLQHPLSLNKRNHKSSEESINLQLTLKSKYTKFSMSNANPRADSLIYSEASLMGSNTGAYIPPQIRLQQHHSALEKPRDKPTNNEQDLQKIQRAVSRQIQRTGRASKSHSEIDQTQSKKIVSQSERPKTQQIQEQVATFKVTSENDKAKELHQEPERQLQMHQRPEEVGSKQKTEEAEEAEEYSRRKSTSRSIISQSRQKVISLKGSRRKSELSQQSQGGIFNTQIKDYKSKIAKIRSLKQQKKLKLEAQLRKVNNQIQSLAHNQSPQSSLKTNPSNNYNSRVKIADNVEAQIKAQKLVKDLRHEKKTRHDAHLGDLKAIDKNIHNYMEELMKERYKNEERLKQRKKFEIIERMKIQQMRKIQEQKQKEKNRQFLNHLKANPPGSNSAGSPSQSKQPYLQPRQSPLPDPKSQHYLSNDRTPPNNKQLNKERSVTKVSNQPSVNANDLTPELSRKKEYLKKIRHLKFKKNVADKYEQSLM